MRSLLERLRNEHGGFQALVAVQQARATGTNSKVTGEHGAGPCDKFPTTNAVLGLHADTVAQIGNSANHNSASYVSRTRGAARTRVHLAAEFHRVGAHQTRPGSSSLRQLLALLLGRGDFQFGSDVLYVGKEQRGIAQETSRARVYRFGKKSWSTRQLFNAG
jgi:hypothetical protein